MKENYSECPQCGWSPSVEKTNFSGAKHKELVRKHIEVEHNDGKVSPCIKVVLWECTMCGTRHEDREDAKRCCP